MQRLTKVDIRARIIANCYMKNGSLNAIFMHYLFGLCP